MNFRNTLLLVLVFGILAGYVYFVEMQKPAEDLQAADKEKYVFTLGQDDLQSLQIKDGDKSVFLVKDAAGKWYVGGVGAAEADVTQMSSVLAGLTDLRASRVITDVSAGLAVYGLEKPGLEANMQVSAEKTESLLVGDKTPQGSTYYAQKKGSPNIYLVPEYLVVELKGLVSNPPYMPTPTVPVTVTTTVTGSVLMTPTLPVTATTTVTP